MINFILFDGRSRNSLLPFTYTRPVAEIRVGIMTIRKKWELHLKANISTSTEAYLQNKYPLTLKDDNIFINASLLPNAELLNAISELKPKKALVKNGEVLVYRADKQYTEAQLTDNLDTIDFSGEISKIQHTWDIFSKNYDQIEADYQALTKNRESNKLPESVKATNPENIFLEDGVILEHCTINASEGPVYLGKNAKVLDGSLLRGPLAVGHNALIKLGARIYGGTTIGPYCKVGGEISNSVMFAYSNKAHDGYLGNSVLGEWCNLGADTNTSNLKNNYAEVRLWNYQAERFSPTGLQFCGLMMGDHSKCGINTMFNTGTVVGVSANIFGSGYPRNFIPSFSWGGASGFTTYQTRKAFEVMRAVLKRKNMEVPQEDIEIMEYIFEMTKKWRKDESC